MTIGQKFLEHCSVQSAPRSVRKLLPSAAGVWLELQDIGGSKGEKRWEAAQGESKGTNPHTKPQVEPLLTARVTPHCN